MAGAGADASVVPLLLRGFGWRDGTASDDPRPRHFYQQLWRAAASGGGGLGGGGEGGGGRSGLTPNPTLTLFLTLTLPLP